jgi:hypothetical protein
MESEMETLTPARYMLSLVLDGTSDSVAWASGSMRGEW